tara:strand:- start:180 stop:623 length:444 start_codon:yes stop_codon:yes gene_type:complete
MRLKDKLFYIVIGATLLASFQIGFWSSPKAAYADGHLASEKKDKSEPVKMIYFVNYPLGGKAEYLEWVKEVGPKLVTEEVVRIRSYDNFEGGNPHRLVEMEFNSIEDMQKYQRNPEIRAIIQDMSNHTSSSEMHTFIQRSDYSKLSP